MISFLLLVIPICFSQNYPETKTLRGGVFTWPSALALSRKNWKWLKIPSISFNFTDINLEQITKQYLVSNLNFNLNDQIKIWLDDVNETYTENYFETTETKNKFNKYITSGSTKSRYKCNSNEYPNVNLILNGDPGNYECKTVEDTLGQLLSYLLMIMPLFIITILVLIFYLIFAFGRFFCFKPNSRFKPKTHEIVAFVLIFFVLFIAILFNIFGSAYFASKVRYLLSKKIESDLTTVCKNLKPSIKSSIKDTSDDLFPLVDDITSKITTFINESSPSFFELIDKTVNDATIFIKSVENVETFCVKYNESLENVENKYSTCALSAPSDDFDSCPKETSLLKTMNFTKSLKTIRDFDEKMKYSVGIINVTEYIDEVRKDLIESIENMRDDAKKNDFDFFDGFDCNFNETFEIFDSIPSFVSPLFTTVFVLMPIIMIVTFALQVYSFWFTGKFSRACSFLCLPCGFCAIFNFIIGSIGTIGGIIIILYGIVYNQGDEMIDTIVKNITNEDRIIHIGLLDMTSVTDDIIGPFHVDDIKLQKLEIIQNLLNAEVKSSLSKILDVKQLPFEDVAKTIENTINNMTKVIIMHRYYFEIIVEDLDNAMKNALPSNLQNIVSINDLNVKLNRFLNDVTCCGNETAILSKVYNDFIDEFRTLASNYSKSLSDYRIKERRIPDEIGEVALVFLTDFLTTAGSALAKAVRQIPPILDKLDVSWAIGSFNVFRSKFLHHFLLGCMYLSVSAHMYAIAMALMSMLLWYRRRGMDLVSSFENINLESIESGTSSVFNNLIT